MKNTKFKNLIAMVLAAAMLFCLAGCETYNAFKAAFIDPPAEDPVETFKIGVLEPLTGADADSAKDEINGIKLAQKYFPTFMQKEVELIFADNQSDVSVCPIAAQSLADAGVSFIIGSYKSVLTLASSDVILKSKIPAIAATNTNPLVTSTNTFYFRVSYVDSFEGICASEFVTQGLRSAHTLILIEEGNDYASAIANAFAAEYADDLKALYEKETETEEEEAAKLEMFGENFDPVNISIKTVFLPEDKEDYKNYFEVIKNAGIDTIFFPSSAVNAAPVIEAVKELGIDFNWMGTSTWNGIAVDGVYYTMDFDPKKELSEMAMSFRTAYEKEYAEEPSDAAALGFDAYMMIMDVVSRVGTDATAYQYVNALTQVKELNGATGAITMSSGGDPVKDILVEQYKDGDFSAVYTVKGLETTRTFAEEDAAAEPENE